MTNSSSCLLLGVLFRQAPFLSTGRRRYKRDVKLARDQQIKGVRQIERNIPCIRLCQLFDDFTVAA